MADPTGRVRVSVNPWPPISLPAVKQPVVFKREKGAYKVSSGTERGFKCFLSGTGADAGGVSIVEFLQKETQVEDLLWKKGRIRVFIRCCCRAARSLWCCRTTRSRPPRRRWPCSRRRRTRSGPGTGSGSSWRRWRTRWRSGWPGPG